MRDDCLETHYLITYPLKATVTNKYIVCMLKKKKKNHITKASRPTETHPIHSLPSYESVQLANEALKEERTL